MANTQPLILIVEDNRLIAFNIRMELEQSGFQVATATGGDAALYQVRECRPDMILMDINLNEAVNGIGVMQKIQREFGVVPHFYLTGYSDSEIRHAADTSPLGIFEKPVQPQRLIEAIRIHL